MSLETETKKIANNLQQLTDAIVTLTEVMKLQKPVVIPTPDETVDKQPIDMTNREKVKPIVVEADNVVDITAGTEVIGTVNNVLATAEKVVATVNPVVDSTAGAMTMGEANIELNRIVGEMGDGGIKIKELLHEHNAVSLAQIPVENYRAFVDEAQALIPAKQA